MAALNIDVSYFENWTLCILGSFLCFTYTNAALRPPVLPPRQKPPILPSIEDIIRQRHIDLRGQRIVIVMKDTFTSRPKNDSSAWQRFKYRDGYVLDAFQQITGCLPVVIPPKGCTFANTTCSASDNVLNGSADISFVAEYVEPQITSVEWTPAFHYGYNSVVLPRAGGTNGVLELVEGVETIVLIILVAVVVLATIIWRASFPHSRPSILKATSIVLAVIISKPSHKVSNISPTTARVLVSTYSAFSIVFVCLFQGFLIENMTNMIFERAIETLQEIDDLNFEIISSSPSGARAFSRSDSPLLNRLYAKVKIRDEFEDDEVPMLEWLSNQDHSAVVMTQISYLVHVSYVSIGKESIYEVKEHPSFYFLGYLLPIGSPFAEQVRNLCGRLLQSGLMRHWYEDSIEGYSVKLRKTMRTKGVIPSDDIGSHHTVKTIKLNDFQSVFALLGFSYAFSVMIFILEIAVTKWSFPFSRREDGHTIQFIN